MSAEQSQMQDRITKEDREILRELAKRKVAFAHSPENVERRRLWYAHLSGKGERPMVLAEHVGIMDSSRPFMPELKCAGDFARGIEGGIVQELWRVENLCDDYVVEPYINTHWHVAIGNYGVETVWHESPSATHLSAKRWDPPLKNLSDDLCKLQPRSCNVDKEASLAGKALLEEIFDGILPVRFRGGYWWTLGMTQEAVFLVGMEGLMMSMYDDPDGLHGLMRFLLQDHLRVTRWLEEEGLLSLNNENDYTGSGSMGYTTELPSSRSMDAQQVKREDLWVLLESQETVGVGPELFEEFIYPYQKQIAETFGLVYYGCCEPVHTRWHILRNMPNLRSVSVSPWCDQAFMAEALGREYIFSRKPNPALISTTVFDESAIRQDIRSTLDAGGDCSLEIIMKDVHTLNNEPHRLRQWVEIAREEIDINNGPSRSV